jgi:quercetin dioxygenase-like cupin family protein
MWGEKIMMSLVEIAPNSQVPMHAHPHEQAGMVLEGEFDFTIGGETTRMKQGDFYIIPGGVEHGLVSLDGWSSALDIFSPPREEYKT